MGNLMLTILAGMAQMEREMMLLRQSEGIAAPRAAGRTVAKELGVSLSTVQRVLKEAAQ